MTGFCNISNYDIFIPFVSIVIVDSISKIYNVERSSVGNSSYDKTIGSTYKQWQDDILKQSFSTPTNNSILKKVKLQVCCFQIPNAWGLVQKKWSQSVTWRSKNQSQKWCLDFIINRLSYGQGQEKWGRLHSFWTRPWIVSPEW